MLKNYRLLYTIGPNKSGAWEISFGIGNMTSRWALVMGWGYDHEMPVSLFPQFVSKILPKSGAHYKCFSWCGFFICNGVS
jgi:hypothetical protein